MASFVPPDRFDEYQVLRLLGSGAMGSVYLARDTLLDRLVAIKFVAALAPTPAARDRFVVEARAIARLTHPNVVAIHRVGMLDDRPFLVSEYIRGGSLDRLALPVAADLLERITLGVARGLAAVHRHGIVHRDIKPANVILSDEGDVKLVDFGLAKLLGQGPEPGADDGAVLAYRSDRPPPSVSPAASSVDGGVTMSLVGLAATHAAPSEGVASAPPHAAELTLAGTVLGTPRYMAPESWEGAPGTPRSDVYALGVLLFEIASGAPPHAVHELTELARRVRTLDCPALAAVAPNVNVRFAALVDRCLRRDPRERFASAEPLRGQLEEVFSARRPVAQLFGNPYRGLHAFHEEHAAAFFGRGPDIRDVVELLRMAPIVTVAGSSGVGKSSLCRAGVLPAVAVGELFPGRVFHTVSMTPGRNPLSALASALAEGTGLPVEGLLDDFHTRPGDPSRRVRAALGRDRGLVLFVDQLEEVVTLSSERDARLFGETLARLCEDAGPLRVLLSTREDFLGRVAVSTTLGAALARAVHILGPLRGQGLREAIEAPARARGYGFAPASTVEILAAWVEQAEAGLPLLQFALAELWEARDEPAHALTQAALEGMGGVAGALARHADAVVLGLLPDERREVRRIFGQLVTREGTRAQCTHRELGAERGPGAAALEALVRGRLLFTRASPDGDESVAEIAHEVLLRDWGTLRGWLASDADARALRDRLGRAAADWERLGRPSDALWGAGQVVESRALGDGTLGTREAQFLKASRWAVRRRRWGWVAAALAVPSFALGATVVVRAGARRQLDARIAEVRRIADPARARAHALADAAALSRREAFARFDARDRAGAEDLWDRARRQGAEAQEAFGQGLRGLDAALALDDRRASTREALAAAALDAIRLAEAERQPELRAALEARLSRVDDGPRLAELSAPGTLRLRTRPSGAAVNVARVGAGDRRPLATVAHVGPTPVDSFALAPGSYVLKVEAPGRPPVMAPVVVAAGEGIALDLELPAASDVPEGFVYVPAGRFLFGSSGDEDLRRSFYDTAPMHEVTLGAYLIAQHETTFGEWIKYLRELPPRVRAERLPRASTAGLNGSLRLEEDAQGAFALRLQPSERVYYARMEEPIVYEARTRRARQDWRRFPVAGVTPDDAAAYAAWLDATGRVRGARLCTEHEWERAARGADDRRWPHGDRLEPDDANHDETYGRLPVAFGPDEVGQHPASRSPFGVDDLVGNVWEIVESSLSPGERVVRGGSYYFGRRTSVVINRNAAEPGLRDATVGVRLCASWPR